VTVRAIVFHELGAVTVRAIVFHELGAVTPKQG